MAIPDYQSIMLPLLRFASDGNEHSLREAIEGLVEKFGLTDAERKELLPSGQQTIFENRVGWASLGEKVSGTFLVRRAGWESTGFPDDR